MKLKRQMGGLVRDPIYLFIGQKLKKPSERISPIGPITVDGKKFVAITYFNRGSYYKWWIKNGLNLFLSFFYPALFLRLTSLTKETKGMMLVDDKQHVIINKKHQLRIAQTAMAWIDIYLCPSFKPGTFKIVDQQLKAQKRLAEKWKKRKIPKAKGPVEQLYLEQLKKADKQVLEYQPIIERNHSLVRNAENFFYGISENPSETKVLHMKQIMTRLSSNFQELAEWCSRRAKSWPDFVDSKELYDEYKNKKKSLTERFGLGAIRESLMTLIGYVVCGGNLAFSLIFAVIGKFGFDGLKILLSFRWQAYFLRRQARTYRILSERAENFLRIYEIPTKNGFIRSRVDL